MTETVRLDQVVRARPLALFSANVTTHVNSVDGAVLRYALASVAVVSLHNATKSNVRFR